MSGLKKTGQAMRRVSGGGYAAARCALEARRPLPCVTPPATGGYQYSRTRMRFRAAKSALHPNEEPTEWCDAHGVDHPDTKVCVFVCAVWWRRWWRRRLQRA